MKGYKIVEQYLTEEQINEWHEGNPYCLKLFKKKTDKHGRVKIPIKTRDDCDYLNVISYIAIHTGQIKHIRRGKEGGHVLATIECREFVLANHYDAIDIHYMYGESAGILALDSESEYYEPYLVGKGGSMNAE